jgi:hypothetical protein
MPYSSSTQMRGGDMAADDDAFYRPPDRGDGAKSVDDVEKNPETALLPKSILGDQDLKEGAQITLRIVKDFGDEVEVARSEPEKQREPGAGGMPPVPADDELATMDESGT